jgi:hypothetical protein
MELPDGDYLSGALCFGGFGQMAKGIALRCHLASPSLGQYASLSFIVRGRSQRSEGTRLRQGFRLRYNFGETSRRGKEGSGRRAGVRK